MGRPNLSEVRTAEILDAFQRCVAQYGLEGSSLERVAEEAGMKRSILRHYIGNRDDLIHALAERVVAKYRQHFQQYLESVSEQRRIRQLLDFFFPERPLETAESVMVAEALIGAADQYPEVRKLMLGYVDDLVSQVADQLRLAFSNANKRRCWNVAYGLVSIWFNQESLSALGLPSKYLTAARTSSELLIQSLDNQ